MSKPEEEDNELIEPVEDEEQDQEKPIKVDAKLYSYPADFTLEVLNDKIANGEIEVPPFQRKYVWTKEGASMLIESFMRSLPVPPIYLFTTPDHKLWIIDGHQRLMTIKRFFGNEWEGEEGFKLTIGESSDLNNKSYEEFSQTDQRKLKNSVMRAVIIEPREGDSDKALYDMFERLNTGGVLLKPQEIRNCVYHGKLNDLLHRLNAVNEWRKILGADIEDKRQRDVELILRGLALYHVGKKINGSEEELKYRPSLKEFLNNFMEANQNPDDEWLNKMEVLFSDTVKLILEKLGEKPFHLRRAMNAATFDSVFVAFAKHLNAIPKNIKTRYEDLKNNEEFRSYVEERPAGEKSVSGRLNISQEILFRR